MLAGTALLAVAVVVVLYNRLVRLRVRCNHAWAQVEAQLQRRHDLLPGLVAVVAAYAGHERGVLDEVTRARTAALTPGDAGRRLAAEDALGEALGRLLAVTEAYPQLRADERFGQLQTELADTEDRIAFARGFANDRIARYRTALQAFPSVLVARAFRFQDRPMLEADPASATAPIATLGEPDDGGAAGRDPAGGGGAAG